MPPRNHQPDSLRPGTARLLGRVAGWLGFASGGLLVLGFLLGILREDAYRWFVLVAGVTLLLSPLAVRVLLPR